MKKSEIAQHASRYLWVIEWSDDDHCFIGSAPPLIGQCCHGDSQEAVLKQLRVIVDDVIATMLKHGDPFPPGTAGKAYSGKFLVRISREMHRKAALKALARGESLNDFVAGAIARA